MSDLQCPVTILLVPPGVRAAPPTADEAPTALVYAPAGRSDEAEAIAAARRSVVRRDDGLGSGDATALATALEELSDLHRGETIVALAQGLPPGCPAGRVTRVRIDGDGWAVEPLPA